MYTVFYVAPGLGTYEFAGKKYWLVVFKGNLADTVDTSALSKYEQIRGNDLRSIISSLWNSKSHEIKHISNELYLYRVAEAISELMSSKEEVESGGATCIKCGNYNEYALSTTAFICGSCKSYKEMIG